MPWRSWRKAEMGGDDGGLEPLPHRINEELRYSKMTWKSTWKELEGFGLPELRNALRCLTRGFLNLSAEEADMVARYTDVMVNRGGLPIYQLPIPRDDMEDTA